MGGTLLPAVSLEYRKVAEMLAEQGVEVDHSTIYQWVQRYTSEMDKRCRRYLRATNAAA